MDTVDKIIAFESGELSDVEIIEFFAGLIKSDGIISAISGGRRMVGCLIDSGYIDKTGKVLKYPKNERNKKMEHTEKSWEVTKHATPDYAPQYGVYISGERNDFCIVMGEDAEAKAHLIAAAPDLLAASKIGLDYVCKADSCSKPDCTVCTANKEARGVIEQAIAKAEK